MQFLSWPNVSMQIRCLQGKSLGGKMVSVSADIQGKVKVSVSELKKRYRSIPTPYTPTLRYPDMLFFLCTVALEGTTQGAQPPSLSEVAHLLCILYWIPKQTQTSIGFFSWNSAIVFWIRPSRDLKCTQVKYQFWASCPLKKRWNIVTVRLFVHV